MLPAHQAVPCGISNKWLLLVFLPLILLSSQALALPQKLGDLDGDGEATVLDIVRLINHINGSVPLSPDLQVLADVNQDGTINDVDVALIANAVVGLSILPNLPLDTIRLSSPLNGETEVAVTRETFFKFTEPLSSSTLITTNNLYFGNSNVKIVVHENNMPGISYTPETMHATCCSFRLLS